MIDIERMNQQMASELGGILRQHNQNIVNLFNENNRLVALIEELKQKGMPEVEQLQSYYKKQIEEKAVLEKKVARLEKQVKHLINQIEE
jgi:cell division protein FtsB